MSGKSDWIHLFCMSVNNHTRNSWVVGLTSFRQYFSMTMRKRTRLAVRACRIKVIEAIYHSSVARIILFVGLLGSFSLVGRAADLKTIKEKAGVNTNAIASANTNKTILPSDMSPSSSIDNMVKLGIGDRLSFRIVEDQDDAKALFVTDSGDLDVPYIGRVKAENRTCRELTQEIKARLEAEYYYQANVILALDQFNRSRGKVYLVGYVRVPGPQDVPTDEVFTLSKAVMRAGGFTDFADKKHVRVTRNAGTNAAASNVLMIDVGAILEEGRAEKDIKLEAGDLVYVPSRLFKF